MSVIAEYEIFVTDVKKNDLLILFVLSPNLKLMV